MYPNERYQQKDTKELHLNVEMISFKYSRRISKIILSYYNKEFKYAIVLAN